MSPSPGLLPWGAAGWSQPLTLLFPQRGCAAALGFGLLSWGKGTGQAAWHVIYYLCFITVEVGGVDGFITPPWQVRAVTARSFLNGFVLAWS